MGPFQRLERASTCHGTIPPGVSSSRRRHGLKYCPRERCEQAVRRKSAAAAPDEGRPVLTADAAALPVAARDVRFLDSARMSPTSKARDSLVVRNNGLPRCADTATRIGEATPLSPRRRAPRPLPAPVIRCMPYASAARMPTLPARACPQVRYPWGVGRRRERTEGTPRREERVVNTRSSRRGFDRARMRPVRAGPGARAPLAALVNATARPGVRRSVLTGTAAAS